MGDAAREPMVDAFVALDKLLVDDISVQIDSRPIGRLIVTGHISGEVMNGILKIAAAHELTARFIGVELLSGDTPDPVGFANSGGLVFVNESAEEVATV